VLETALKKTEPVTRFFKGRLYRLKLRFWSIAADVRRVAKVVATVAAVLLAIEVAAAIAFAFAHRHDPTGDPRAQADAYGGAAWTERHYQDLRALSATARWGPELPRIGPFEGATIHVDDAGLRRTWRSPSAAPAASAATAASAAPAPTGTASVAAAASSTRVVVLGGSAVFGAGARDDETIPSLLARAIARRREDGGATVVDNLGQVGRTERACVAALESELREGRRPDVAVLCVGWEDAVAACANGRAGLPIDASRRDAEYGVLASRGTLAWAWIRRTVGESSTVRALGLARDALAGKRELALDAPAAERLAADVVAEHGKDVAHVRRLEKAYGFVALWYVQPTLHDKTARSGYEETVLARELEAVPGAHGKDLQPLLAAMAVAREKAPRDAGDHIRDLRDAFAKDGEPRFVDVSDLADKGNTALAERIAADVLPLVESAPKK
jgi:hypothetical protein